MEHPELHHFTECEARNFDRLPCCVEKLGKAIFEQVELNLLAFCMPSWLAQGQLYLFYVFMYVYVCICMYVYMYVSMYVYMRVCVYVYVDILQDVLEVLFYFHMLQTMSPYVGTSGLYNYLSNSSVILDSK
jgi:hypothetical protein